MNYEQAKEQRNKSTLKIGTSNYTILSNNIGFEIGSRVHIPYILKDITISTVEKLDYVQFEKSKGLTDEDALKSLGLIDNEDLETMLTFKNDAVEGLKVMTLTPYLYYLEDSKPQ